MRKLAIAAATSVVLAATTWAVATAANADSGTVVRVIDGDTVVVSINNNDQTIRLLNINTPETKDPNKPTECLGPEATDHLEEVLPVGSKVRLEFDVERHDKYKRTLAGVFNASNQLVNAEIARRGLGVPMVVEPNRKFLPPVEAAYQEARAAKAGLFSETVECTLPAQLAAASEALTMAENAAPATTSAGAGANATGLAAALVAAKAARDLLSASRDTEHSIVWAAYEPAEAAGKLTALTARITRGESALAKAKDQEKSLAAAPRRRRLRRNGWPPLRVRRLRRRQPRKPLPLKRRLLMRRPQQNRPGQPRRPPRLGGSATPRLRRLSSSMFRQHSSTFHRHPQPRRTQRRATRVPAATRPAERPGVPAEPWKQARHRRSAVPGLLRIRIHVRSPLPLNSHE
ncbi:thermonuclease family protein [Paenarthrobacter nitroguajacolicus]|uniref:thermonuclease family protein n=1 Tax=Paenarthrobacter nitroguajacolicus TaxID=211146 RepID=UPI003AD8CFCF